MLCGLLIIYPKVVRKGAHRAVSPGSASLQNHPEKKGLGDKADCPPLQGLGARDNAQNAGAAQARAGQPWAEL